MDITKLVDQARELRKSRIRQNEQCHLIDAVHEVVMASPAPKGTIGEVIQYSEELTNKVLCEIRPALKLKDGKYTFYQGRFKPVILDVAFDSEGNVKSAKDAKGNSWTQWLIDYKALDPSRPENRLEPVKELIAAKEGKNDV